MYTAWHPRVGELKKNAVDIPLRPQAHSCCLASCQTQRQKQEDFCKISSNNCRSLFQHYHHDHLFLKKKNGVDNLRSRSISPFLGKLPLPLIRFLYPLPPEGGPDGLSFYKFIPLCTKVPGHLFRPLGVPGRVKGSSAHILPTQYPIVVHSQGLNFPGREGASSYLLHAASRSA